MVQITDDFMLVVIHITVWIQEFLKDFFLIALNSIIGGVLPWRMCVLSKCYGFIIKV